VHAALAWPPLRYGQACAALSTLNPPADSMAPEDGRVLAHVRRRPRLGVRMGLSCRWRPACRCAPPVGRIRTPSSGPHRPCCYGWMGGYSWRAEIGTPESCAVVAACHTAPPDRTSGAEAHTPSSRRPYGRTVPGSSTSLRTWGASVLPVAAHRARPPSVPRRQKGAAPLCDRQAPLSAGAPFLSRFFEMAG
jgi:hypothetical protein